MAFQAPVVLQGRWVALVPLERQHAPALARAGRDPSIWTFMRHGVGSGEGAMEELIEGLLAQQAAGTDLAFTMFYRPEGAVVGMTRFLDIHRPDRGVEIGGTWIDPRLWRTPVNTESKFLLLQYAFETEGCLRVQFKTDLRNLRSQRAIERLGARREGTFRKHIVMPDGYVRDSVFYSITDDDWPQVKAHLQGFLAQPWRSSGGSEGGPA